MPPKIAVNMFRLSMFSLIDSVHNVLGDRLCAAAAYDRHRMHPTYVVSSSNKRNLPALRLVLNVHCSPLLLYSALFRHQIYEVCLLCVLLVLDMHTSKNASLWPTLPVDCVVIEQRPPRCRQC